jgi:GGDEF domain-containing protein/xanthosine utilization system XapX-like protein
VSTTRRKRTRGVSKVDAGDTVRTPRQASLGESVEIDDAQMIEVADLGSPPRTTVAVLDTAEHVAEARATVEALGHTLASAGSGAAAGRKLLELLRAPAPPEVVVVGLPGGEAVIDAARALEPRRPVLVAAIGGAGATAADRAHAAGADLVTRRPHDAEHLGPVLMAAAVLAAERARLLTLQGNEQLLRARLDEPDPFDGETGFTSFERFKQVLELELKRARRYHYQLSVCQLALNRGDPPPPVAIVHQLRMKVVRAVRSAIRDIDYPVEIADDRFLVLLPYTDTIGATLVARRILGAIRDAGPVPDAGRAWTPAVSCGVAGVPPGQPVSMAQLMRDAGEALRSARQRNVDLVVAT